jgi:thioester reductase-like protein
MVGREILARAALDDRFDRVICLVRPPVDRIAGLLAAHGVARTGHVSGVAGDLTEPDLGLSALSIVRGVTHVIHCAATVSFDQPLPEARRINVGGTRGVLDLCRRLPALERIDAVSTCYVAGRCGGLAREADLEHDRGFHNTYEQTKYEAEQLLRAAMRELPIAVHRPSIVVGDSRTGRTGSWKVLYWPMKVLARGWLPIVPYDPLGRLDIVPVDFVASAIIHLTHDAGALGRTFHLAAGPGRDTTLGALAERLSGRLGRRRPFRVRPSWWRRVIRPGLMLLPSKPLHRTLRSGLVYRPYLELRVQFDTTNADAALQPAGIRCPPVLDYIDTVVDAALASDFGRRAVSPA